MNSVIKRPYEGKYDRILRTKINSLLHARGWRTRDAKGRYMRTGRISDEEYATFVALYNLGWADGHIEGIDVGTDRW